MQVKFCFTDSGTGENDVVTLTVQNMSHNEFETVFNQYLNYGDEIPSVHYTLQSLINHGSAFAAILTTIDPYFGPVIITGIVYTNFV